MDDKEKARISGFLHAAGVAWDSTGNTGMARDLCDHFDYSIEQIRGLSLSDHAQEFVETFIGELRPRRKA